MRNGTSVTANCSANMAQGTEEADQHEQHKLARVRHNEIADDERQGTEHAEG